MSEISLIFIIEKKFFLTGYVLGNFISRRTQHLVKLELEDISERVSMLNNNLKYVFGNGSNHNCSRTYICYSYNMNDSFTSQQILDSLINCFTYI